MFYCFCIVLIVLCIFVFVVCNNGIVKCVLELVVSLQQLIVCVDGNWIVVLCLQNFSLMLMIFDDVLLVLIVGDNEVGILQVRFGIFIGGIFVDVINIDFVFSLVVCLVVVDVLVSNCILVYGLKGMVVVILQEKKQCSFDISSCSIFNQVLGLLGVLC